MCEEWINLRQFSCMHEQRNEKGSMMCVIVAAAAAHRYCMLWKSIVSINILFWSVTYVIKIESTHNLYIKLTNIHLQNRKSKLVLDIPMSVP